MLIDAIYLLLKEVNESVYPGVAEQEVEAPFIVHAIVKTIPNASKDGASTKDLVIYRIASYATTQNAAQTQADSIRAEIDEYSGLVSGLDLKIRFDDEENGFDNTEDVNLYYTLQTYRVWINYNT